MPVVIGWILRLGAKLLKGWWIPILAAVGAWIAEAFLGVISWSVVQVGGGLLEVVLDSIVDLQIWVDARPDWDGLCGTGGALATSTYGNACAWMYSLLSLTGVLSAIAIVVSGFTLRMLVKLVTLGRY